MKTVLFGLDGATFTILDHLVAEGVMPHLAELYRRGARGRLQSTPLPLTPQAWTSMSTGRSPGHHGISDWVRFDWGPRGNFGHINDSRDNHCETVWEYVSRQNKRVTVLNYYGLAPARPLNGHSMPGFTSGRHLRRSSQPADLFSRLEQVDGFDVKILGLDLEIERQVLQEMPAERWHEWTRHHILRDRTWFAVLEHLMRTEPSDLSAIVFDGVDKLQHLAYRYLDPAFAPRQASNAWEAETIRLCRDYFRQIDDFLGRTLELAGAWGRVFLVSDHGFCATQEIFYLNKWLHDHGYLVWRGEAIEDDQEACATMRPENDANAIDLERSRAFAFTPSANGIFLQVPEHEYHAFREKLIAELFELRAPDGGQVVIDVKRREEFFAGPQMERFPDLTLTLRDYGFVSVLNAKQAILPRSVVTGTHHPLGVFLGVGPGIVPGADLGELNLLDVAPVLLHSLGLAIPAEYEGHVPDGLYDPSYLASDPPRIAAPERSATPQVVDDSPTEADEEDQSIIFERLRSLGYIE